MRKILKCRAIFYWQIYVIKIKWKNNNSEKLTLFYGSYRDTIYFRHFVYVYDWYTKLDSFIPKCRQPYLVVKAHFAYLGFASLISMAILGVASITANYKLL